jgi:hypothetical protein
VLDPALLRPGRFDRRIIVDRPDLKGRVNILKVHAKKVLLDDTVNFDEIALATSGAVGSDLAEIDWTEFFSAEDGFDGVLDPASGNFDVSGVDLNTVGAYKVKGFYSDKAGNEGSESNFTEYYPVCNKTETGISNIQHSAISHTEYYDLNGHRLSAPQKGISIRVELMANGQKKTTKVIK